MHDIILFKIPGTCLKWLIIICKDEGYIKTHVSESHGKVK